MKKKTATPAPRVDVKEFGDVHELSYNIEHDKMEVIGLLGPFDIVHMLDAIAESRAGSSRKVDMDIAEHAKKLAAAVVKGCVTARTFAFVSNGPAVRLATLDEERLLETKKKARVATKKRAKEIEYKEKALKAT